MTLPPSRYGSGEVPDYSHRFHAGNVGDVWKQCALIALLDPVAATANDVTYIESHAGEGSYSLGPTGEWSEGIGRLWRDDDLALRADPVRRYLSLSRELGASKYDAQGERPSRVPGSPLLARSVLGADAKLVLFERDGNAFERLTSELAGDPLVRLVQDDGLRDLAAVAAAAEQTSDTAVVLIDPPWSEKADWTSVPDVLAAVVKSATRACFMLWYPVKSLTRPNAMIARLAAAGVAGSIAELVTTPLEYQRNRLNGSGVLRLRPPAELLSLLAAAAPVFGARCATRPDAWSFRMQAWPSAA